MSRSAPYITRFDGMRLPSTDFGAVRNDLQIEYLYYEQDLTAAHSIAAGSQITLPLKGNSIYVDQAADVGSATIVFHDQSLSAKPGKVFVQPGFNANIPFDVITIENVAQVGKVLRIFYGVDIDFKPGIAGVVTIPGLVNVADVGLVPGTNFSSNANLVGNTPLNVFLAASNLNGARLHDVSVQAINATGVAAASGICNAIAPTTVVDGEIVASVIMVNQAAGFFLTQARILKPRRIAAGKRLDFIVFPTDTGTPVKHAAYDLL